MARYTTTDPETGLSLRKALYGASEAEARAKLIEALSARQTGALTITRGRAPTLGAYVKHWLATKRVRPKSLRRYDELLRLHVVPTLGGVQLTKLTPTNVNGLLTKLAKAGLASRTVNHTRAVLRNCLADAVRDGYTVRNVAELARPMPLNDVAEAKVLTAEQTRVFLKSVQSHPDGALWTVALTTGCRQGELLGLTWVDVDLEAGTIRIARTLQYNQAGGFDVLPPKTRRSTRTLALAMVARDALKQHQDRQAEVRRRSETWDQRYGDLVFTDGRGRPLLAPNISKRLRSHLEDKKLPVIRFHDLRHGFASLLLAQGVAARVAMEVLGHSDIATTSNIYQHVGAELQREAANAIDRALRQGEAAHLAGQELGGASQDLA